MQHIRLPRLLAAVIAGAGLSVSGLIMQTVLGNPMEETETKTDSGKNGADSSEQLRWSDVYKEALTPVVDSTGIITIYLTQGKNAVYNDGKTAAKYQSSDKGSTWKYIGQVEIKD